MRHIKGFYEAINEQAQQEKLDGALCLAVSKGDMETASALIGEGADVNNRLGGDGRSPLHVAATVGNIDIVRMLLEEGAGVNSRADTLWTPLHVASFDWIEVVRFLLEEGAEVNARDAYMSTPLHWAVSGDQGLTTQRIILALLDAGAEVDAEDDHGLTPLGEAIRHGESSEDGGLSRVRLLLSRGARTYPTLVEAFRDEVEFLDFFRGDVSDVSDLERIIADLELKGTRMF